MISRYLGGLNIIMTILKRKREAEEKQGEMTMNHWSE
jgi:hypothetical protein